MSAHSGVISSGTAGAAEAPVTFRVGGFRWGGGGDDGASRDCSGEREQGHRR